GVRWEPDATLRFAPLTQHVLPQTPPRRIRFPPEPFSPTSYFANKLTAVFFSNYPAMSSPLGLRWEADANTPPCSARPLSPQQNMAQG
ncbi:MAG: hypothetical protein RR719_08405, partial [Akkermansia sp.]